MDDYLTALSAKYENCTVHSDNTISEDLTPGVLDENFCFEKLPDGSLDKSKVVCTFCSTEVKQV